MHKILTIDFICIQMFRIIFSNMFIIIDNVSFPENILSYFIGNHQSSPINQIEKYIYKMIHDKRQ